MHGMIPAALRQMRRNRQFALINGLGLALGLATSMLIFFYVYHETGFDRHHRQFHRIYRVTSWNSMSDEHMAGAPYPLAEQIPKELPEVEAVGRLSACDILVVRANQAFKETRVMRADKALFKIFNWPLRSGDAETALSDPHSVVLTESMAKKYFGNQDPMGQVLNVRTRRGTRYDAQIHPCTVTGVMADFPIRSHVHADLILPLASIAWGYEDTNRKKAVPSYESWGYPGSYTYCLLKPNADPLDLENRLNTAMTALHSQKQHLKFSFQPLKAIHLSGGQYVYEYEPQADRGRIALFTLIAGLILLIAIINALILSTAQAAKRSREVGIRKIVGAKSRDLVKQILGESVVTALVALPPALALVVLLMPVAGRLLQVELELSALLEWPFLLGMVLITVMTGLATGVYLAVSMAGASPIQTLSNRLRSGGKTGFRNVLIGLQLVVFLVLSIMAMTIDRQVGYLFSGRNLGFNASGVISVEVKDRDFSPRFEAMKRELLKHPDILFAATSQEEGAANRFSLGYYNQIKHSKYGSYWASGGGKMSGPNVIQVQELAYSSVDPDFVPALGLTLVAGRNFDPTIPSDRRAILVNETFVKKWGLEDPVGQEVKYIDEQRRIIGVLKDFHTENFYEPIPPLILQWNTQWMNQIVLRLNPENPAAGIAHLKTVWDQFCPGSPLDYTFLEDDQGAMYQSEIRFGTLLGSFAALAIGIAVLGLWGLAAFIAVQRTHEIGVRKVLGASASRVVGLLSRDFIVLVVVANLLAAPLAWTLAQKWLQQYAYRLPVSMWHFVIVGGISLAVTLLAVNLHAVKAARMNPIKTLRSE